MGRLFNIAKMTTATSGTGTVTLGSAAPGYITFADAGVQDGHVVTYVLEEGNNREIGVGTYTSSGTTLSRTTVLASTAGGTTKITLAGAALAFITAAAEDIGKAIQVVNTQTGALATGTTLIPLDDTIPQNTEGNEYMTLAITPKSALSQLKIEVVVQGSPSAIAAATAALFQDSTANALATGFQTVRGGGDMLSIAFTHYMTAGTTSSTTFKVRVGLNNAGTFTFNGTGGARRYGGTMASSITITEYRVG